MKNKKYEKTANSEHIQTVRYNSALHIRLLRWAFGIASPSLMHLTGRARLTFREALTGRFDLTKKADGWPL